METAVELTEEQKVAILLASMNEKIAASILQQLEPEIMGRVANAIRNLGIVSGAVRDKAIADCVRGIVEMGNSIQGNDNTVNNLLAQAIGEKRAAALLSDKESMPRDAFNELNDVPDDQIVSILSGEQASVTAIVLRYLHADKAASVLTLLPSDLRRTAVVMMCKAQLPSGDTINCIEKYIQDKTKGGKGGKGGKKAKKGEGEDHLEIVANILQAIDRTVEEELIGAIEESSDTLGGEIRDRLFTFEDLIKLSDVAMRRLLQEVDMSLLAFALRGAPMNVRSKFFSNMSKRAAEGLKEEMEYSQKVKMSEVKEKQKEIVNIIRSLESDGQITVSAGGEDEYV